MKIHLLLIGWLVLSLSAAGQQQATPTPQPKFAEINTTLMETTVRISGPSARVGEGNAVRCGTAFIMLRFVQPNSTQARHVLVTARHVLDDIRSDEAIVKLRRRNAAGDP